MLCKSILNLNARNFIKDFETPPKATQHRNSRVSNRVRNGASELYRM